MNEPKTHFTSEETRIINLAVCMAAKGFDLSDNPFPTSESMHPIWESGFHAFTRLQKTYSPPEPRMKQPPSEVALTISYLRHRPSNLAEKREHIVASNGNCGNCKLQRQLFCRVKNKRVKKERYCEHWK